MVRIEEDNFPRGSKKIIVGEKRKSGNDTLFATEKPKKQKKEKVTDVNVEDVILASLSNRGVLNKSTLQEGMIVLSCIRKITEHSLEVELPGLLTAKVTIDAISDSFNVFLKKALASSDSSSICEALKKIFNKGQYVPFKLRNIQNDDDEVKLFGSISPSEVNIGRRHNSFRKGEMLWAAVVSELDHGYQLDCGIPNCRIFLPTQNIEEGRELTIGQPIWCKVHKVDNEKAASTLRVGAKKQHIDSVMVDESIPLNLILPGTKVEVFVEKVLCHGIYCKFLNEYVGFIHDSQLCPPLLKLNNIKEAGTIPAYVLYVEETTKITHLSMRGLDSDLELTYSRGEKVLGKVIGKCPTGLYFRLNQKDRGWVSNRRLLHTRKNSTKDKYINGSKHQCVILNYNHMDRVYICGIEKDLIKEKYFNFNDFSVGELVEGTIYSIIPKGVILAVGQVKGFIPNIHLTDSPYSDKLKTKFTVGKKVKAKVFSCNEENVIFTLKSNFLKDEKRFSSLEDIDLNEIYPALILKAKHFGLSLGFYNNIEGFVPIKEFNFQVTKKYKENPSSFFYSGQVINVKILKIKPEKIIASLLLEGPAYKPIEIGGNVKGIVAKVHEDGLTMYVPKKNIEGFVPVEHLSIDRSLCGPILETYDEKSRISNLLIIKSDEYGTVLSKREASSYERCDLRVPKFQNIRKGALLRCSVESVEANGVFVSTPIKNFNKKIFVERKMICSKGPMPHFEPQQSAVGKVMEIDKLKEIIVLSLRIQNVFDHNLQNTIDLFCEYLADEEYLHKFGSRNGWPLNQYSVAEKVLCTVKQISKEGILVELPNGCNGLVVSCLGISSKKGDKVQGIVLGHNYKLKYVEICLNPSIIDHINPNQDGSLPENEVLFTAQKLLKREQYILGVLRKSGNRQLVYLPLRLCENDCSDTLSNLYAVDKFKVEICGKFGDKLIAVHKKLKQSLDYKFMLKNKRRLPLDTSTSSGDVISEAETSVGDVDSKASESGGESSKNILSEENDAMDTEGSDLESEDDSESDSVEDESREENGTASETNEDSGIYSGNNLNLFKKKSSEMDNTESDGDSSSSEEVDSEEDDYEDSHANESHVKFNEVEVREFKEQDQINCPLPILPSITNFFNTNLTKRLDDSSSDDETKEIETRKKKKKLTPSERAEQAKLEEERISKIEKELADSEKEPQSVEQFERILLAEPNSSVWWIKYMSYYLALAEFDKARAVAKKALETINMTLEEEKFNIWISLLNMENLYGTKESFNQVFEDAIKFNDAFKIYMRVLDMLHESGKQIELEEKIKKAKLKFKQEPDMWVQIAKINYLLGKFEEARNTKNACLKSITNAKQQYSLIIKFAILEFTHGEIDVGISIFENVLETYPNRVNAWLVYVDQLISKQQISEARNLLERAIAMKLPLRSMRVIYHKYRSFEEKYGTPQTLTVFKEKARKLLQEKAQDAM
ncbi:hypothetical protein HHI36_005878 [Cryptolaemus montrouzieri]|uniref:S1 motif domain-containing protein n=1 Tax=Cryptolaemus montrouzieri TaxID=559131 RepID=A0ABD2NVP1_9CUCU